METKSNYGNGAGVWRNMPVTSNLHCMQHAALYVRGPVVGYTPKRAKWYFVSSNNRMFLMPFAIDIWTTSLLFPALLVSYWCQESILRK